MRMNKQAIEKAIETIKDLTRGLSDNGRVREANELAIKALEQQLNNGWIPVDSLELMRKINNGIVEVCNEHPYKVVGETDTYSQYNEGWNDACDRIQSKITDILFEQPLPEPYKEDKDAERN